MYAHRYFPSQYFADHYFAGGQATKPAYFTHRYFAQQYFPDHYFPGATEVIAKASYFRHDHFPVRYFTDSYFPGKLFAVVPPVHPPTQFGGGVPIDFGVRPISGDVLLVLPWPRILVDGRVQPTGAIGDAILALGLDLQARGVLTAADVEGLVQLVPSAVLLDGAGRVTRRGRKSSDEEEENALLEWYVSLVGK